MEFKVGDKARVKEDCVASEFRGAVGVVREVYQLCEGVTVCDILFGDEEDGPYDFHELEPVTESAAPTETILEEAQRLTSGDRNADYGHPLDDYNKTGMIWGALLHSWAKEAAKSQTPIPVPPQLASLCMVGVKMSREANKHKRDNLVDGCGYFRIIEMMYDEEERRSLGMGA